MLDDRDFLTTGRNACDHWRHIKRVGAAIADYEDPCVRTGLKEILYRWLSLDCERLAGHIVKCATNALHLIDGAMYLEQDSSSWRDVFEVSQTRLVIDHRE